MIERSVRALLMAGVATAALAGPTWAQDNIGVTAAVNPQAQGTPPDRTTRTLNVGLDMFKNERVVTGPEGKTQLLFVDGSALSIGPNSDVVLDEFVYDPASGNGRLAMTATKGVFRLVGGKLSKNEAVTLKTPTATIGIRGGVGTVVLPAPGGPPPFVSLDFGKALTVEGQGQGGQPVNFNVTRSGTGVLFGPGGTVLPPSPIPQDLFAAALNAVEGSRGSSGGAREQPTDGRVRQAGVGEQGSSLEPEAVREAEALAADISNVATEAGDIVNLDQASTLGFSDLNSSSSSGTSQAFLLRGRYKTTPGSGNARGPGDSSTSFNRPLFGDIIGQFFTGIAIGSSSFSESSFDNNFTAPITGTVLETTPRGTFFQYASTGTTSPFGPISGKGFISSMSDFVFFSSIEEQFSSGLERSIGFAGIATPLSILQPGFGILTYRLEPDAIMGSNLAFLMMASGGGLAGTRSPVFIAPSSMHDPSVLQGNLAIVGQGLSQQSAATVGVGRLVASILGTNINLDGRVRGSNRLGATSAAGFISGPFGMSTDALGNGLFGSDGPNFAVLESSQVSVGANSNPAFADFQSVSLPVPVGLTESSGSTLTSTTYFPTNLAVRIDNPSGVGSSRQSRSLGGFANGFIDIFSSTGSFSGTLLNPFIASGSGFNITTNAGLNTLSGVFNGSASSITFNLPFGGSTLDGTSAFIDDKIYAAVESPSGALRMGSTPSGFQMYVVGNDLVSTTGFLPTGVSYCSCSVSTFGFWGMDVIHANGRDRIHLGQFVAGPVLSSVPSTGGVVSYAGHAVADIVATTSSPQGRFKAAGSFGMSYDLNSAQMTSWNVNFGGGNVITGSGSSGSPGIPNINGSGSGSAPVIGSVSVGINGVFFGTSSGSTPPEVGTQFSGSGTGGRIAGVTQGRLQ
jgi:trimeric autotransporter adhesin